MLEISKTHKGGTETANEKFGVSFLIIILELLYFPNIAGFIFWDIFLGH